MPQANLLPDHARRPIATAGSTALHPSLVEVQNLFSTGQLALLANTGTLTYPTTLTQYNSGSASLPPAAVLPRRPADPVAEQPARPALPDRLGRPPGRHHQCAQYQHADLDVDQRRRRRTPFRSARSSPSMRSARAAPSASPEAPAARSTPRATPPSWTCSTRPEAEPFPGRLREPDRLGDQRQLPADLDPDERHEPPDQVPQHLPGHPAADDRQADLGRAPARA